MGKDSEPPVRAARSGRATAEQLADKQHEISVTEFFEKNKQILGFDSRAKSLLMGVKEAVDNSLDACEEAEILPDIVVKVTKVGEEEYTVSIEDNGPGIVHRAMPNVFGRLLYGSRFHAMRQSRGQQGIGISATVMCPPGNRPTSPRGSRGRRRSRGRWTSPSTPRPTAP